MVIKIDQEHEVVILRDLPNDLDSLKDSLKNLNYSQLYLVHILMVCPRQINFKLYDDFTQLKTWIKSQKG